MQFSSVVLALACCGGWFPGLGLVLAADQGPATERLANGGFEAGMTAWSPFWSRDGKGTATVVADPVHSGHGAAYVQYDGTGDWSLGHSQSFAVTPGEMYELTAWVRVLGPGSATLGVVLYDTTNKPLAWSLGGKTLRTADQWQLVRARFLIPAQGARIVPRLIGTQASQTWLDDMALVQTGSLADLRPAGLAAEVSLRTGPLQLTFHTADATLTVVDARTGRRYEQHAGPPLVVVKAAATDQQITFELLRPDDLLRVRGTIQPQADGAEFVVRLQAPGPLESPLAFPRPFRAVDGEFLIVPVNEGIGYPVDDPTLSDMHYHLYGGHGLCMAFWGATDLERSWMAIVETPDDAAVRITRLDSRLCLAPEWRAQKGMFGPERSVRYVLLPEGGYVAMCKRYRQYAQDQGRFKTLAEKRVANPAVDRLIGAVNVWNWDLPPGEQVREMQQLGMDRILWSHRCEPAVIKELNTRGVLTSRYDIYQDVMDPANFPKLPGVHPDWTSEAWPQDIIMGADGHWTPGWRVKGKDGSWFPCGVLCDLRAVEYARRRIPGELATHPYHCRFIDTTTAAEWRECYHPDHPMTRSDSRQARMALLQYVSANCGLVTGSETGHDAAVPYVHYFEGMLSLGPYRVPDAGRNMLQVMTEVPDRVARFQTGHFYRLPLWELVYHDCVVAQWYWGDYNNKLPALWDRRDLWNALYGTPPMFMFNRRIWRANRERFVRSYQTATPVARATGYSEMVAHQWLTPDHAVQQTRFANGVVVTVNFGETSYSLPGGQTLEPGAHRFEGLDTASGEAQANREK